MSDHDEPFKCNWIQGFHIKYEILPQDVFIENINTLLCFCPIGSYTVSLFASFTIQIFLIKLRFLSILLLLFVFMSWTSSILTSVV